jgi:hypothetical protein
MQQSLLVLFDSYLWRKPLIMISAIYFKEVLSIVLQII